MVAFIGKCTAGDEEIYETLTRETKRMGEKYTIEIRADRIFSSGRRYVEEGKGKRMAHRKGAIRFLLRMNGYA